MTTAIGAGIGRQGPAISYIRVSILGSQTAGEVWSVNPVYDPTGELEIGIDQAKVDAAALAIASRTIPTNLLSCLSTAMSRTGARVEVRADSNDALLATSTQGSPAIATGPLAPKLTPQSAVVCSIRTDTPGGSGRGRLYWPAMGITVSATGRVGTPAVNQLLLDFKSYLNGIRTDLATAFPGITFDLAVRSKATHTTPHATRVQVGDVIDTQRRRRDVLVEAYQSLAFP